MRAMFRPFARKRIQRSLWGAPITRSTMSYSGQPFVSGIQCGYVGEEADRLAFWELQKKMHRGFHEDWLAAPTELAVAPTSIDPALEADLAAVEAELASETPVQGIVIGNLYR